MPRPEELCARLVRFTPLKGPSEYAGYLEPEFHLVRQCTAFGECLYKDFLQFRICEERVTWREVNVFTPGAKIESARQISRSQYIGRSTDLAGQIDNLYEFP